MNPERLKDTLRVAETGDLSADEQVNLVKVVDSLQQTNRKLNRRAQHADVALREAMLALYAKGWEWKGGNFGRAMLAYYSTQLEAEVKRLRGVLEDLLDEADRQTRADAPGVEPDWARDLRAALAEPTASVADQDDESDLAGTAARKERLMDHLLELVKLMRQARHGVKFRIWFDPNDGDRLHFHLLLHQDWPEMKVQRGGQANITFEAIDRDSGAMLERVLGQFCKSLKNTLAELEGGTGG